MTTDHKILHELRTANAVRGAGGGFISKAFAVMFLALALVLLLSIFGGRF